jgi:hypothetical protein
VLLCGLLVVPLHAQFFIRIGDIDGFGYGTATDFKAANGGPANVDGVGVLGNNDYLPDINESGTLRNLDFDEFDFRSAAELANTAVELGIDVTNVATIGSKFTDISLNGQYDTRSAAGQILIGGDPTSGLSHGAGGAFPLQPSSQLPNQPGFVFDFNVEKSRIDPAKPVFFNLVFGDYDVEPARILITKSDMFVKFIPLVRQPSGQNGLIQYATATLPFADVFSDAGTTYHGYLKVDFQAPDEPYTAFDYVELSPVGIPEPASIVILLVMIAIKGLVRPHR